MRFAATLLFAAVLSSDVLAKKGGKRDRDGERKDREVTRAQCVINMDDLESADFRGSAIFYQYEPREEGAELPPSRYFAKFENLAAEKTYSLALLDDDVADCGSAADPLFAFDDKTFSVEADDEFLMGGIKGMGDFDLSGDASYIGKYVQVSNDDGQVGCCMIELVPEGERATKIAKQEGEKERDRDGDGRREGKRDADGDRDGKREGKRDGDRDGGDGRRDGDRDGDRDGRRDGGDRDGGRKGGKKQESQGFFGKIFGMFF